MSKYTIILDAGHGGLVNGKYVTAGKRSPKFDDGKQLYEGVNNREIVNMLITALQAEDIDCIDIVASQNDISLPTRVERANKLHKIKPCLYVSIHSDAGSYTYIDKQCTVRYDKSKHSNVTVFYYKEEWHEASGISVYTSKGQTKSDELATLVIDELQDNFGNSVKWRTDSSDHDEDKEENFYVLKNTNCPAILCELGFHTNKEEATKMLTIEWKNKIVLSLVYAIKKYINKN